MVVLRALGALNKKVLEVYPLISFDDFELANMIPPGLTVVRQPSSQCPGRRLEKYQSVDGCRGEERHIALLFARSYRNHA
jgi:hypothetical protein